MNELVKELKIVARLLDTHSPADAKIVRKAIAALTSKDLDQYRLGYQAAMDEVEGKVCISRECLVVLLSARGDVNHMVGVSNENDSYYVEAQAALEQF